MARFFENFTLADIFNNKKLKGKLPLINYAETTDDDGKVHRRTNAKSVNRLVFDTATSAARPFYEGIKSTRSGNLLSLSGKLRDDKTGQDDAVEAVYNALLAIKPVILWTANNADMIRDALKESEKSKYRSAVTPRLLLRAVSMQQIEGMSKQQTQALMTDIMENVVFGDDYAETQKKWKVASWMFNGLTYEEARAKWRKKVGIE